MIAKLTNGGETIVEVLIVMMVLGSVLTGGFVIAQRATSADQAAQERSEASAYGLEQIERLKSFLASKPLVIAGGKFCMLADNQQNSLPATSTGGCQETVHNRYSGYLELDSTYNSYTETIVWASASGGYDKVTMSYKAKNE